MSRTRALLLACLTAFGVSLVVLLVGQEDDRERAAAGTTAAASPLGRLEADARARPKDVETLVRLGKGYVDAAGDTGDVGFYNRADRVLRKAVALDPQHAAAWTETGVLRLVRHDFRGALVAGRKARALAPEVVKPLGVLVDANVETGRYEDASRVLQEMVDLKPNLDSYARVSYFKELNGDLDGALEALDLAESAAGSSPPNVAFVQSLRATIESNRGRPDVARAAFERILQTVPDHGPAQYGLARMDAGAGRFDAARKRLEPMAESNPELYIMVLLGEIDLADGKPEAARRWFDAVRERRKDFAAANANTDVESAVFEADHGDPEAAVAFARQAWRDAPSVVSADAVGWALTRSGKPRDGLVWARRALRLGSRDPLFLYHAGMAASAAGRPGEAARLLRATLRANRGFSPYHAPRARQALTRAEAEA